jgi:hypothetical protein
MRGGEGCPAPPQKRKFQGCGRKFASRKKARKHKCAKAKVGASFRKAPADQVSRTQPRQRTTSDPPKSLITHPLPLPP